MAFPNFSAQGLEGLSKKGAIVEPIMENLSAIQSYKNYLTKYIDSVSIEEATAVFEVVRGLIERKSLSEKKSFNVKILWTSNDTFDLEFEAIQPALQSEEQDKAEEEPTLVLADKIGDITPVITDLLRESSPKRKEPDSEVEQQQESKILKSAEDIPVTTEDVKLDEETFDSEFEAIQPTFQSEKQDTAEGEPTLVLVDTPKQEAMSNPDVPCPESIGVLHSEPAAERAPSSSERHLEALPDTPIIEKIVEAPPNRSVMLTQFDPEFQS